MTTPFPYQSKGVRKIRHFKWVALLADEMGLGKSAQSLWSIKELFALLKGNRPVVVICPKTIKENWRREAILHVGMRATILNGMKPPKHGLPIQTARFYIINYDILGNANQKRGTWTRWLRKLKPCAVIIDEAHYIKTQGAKRTKAVRELCRGVKHIIALSGTPLTNRPAELFPIVNLLRPDVFPAFLPFAFRYCGARRTPWGWDFRGATRLDELHALLSKTCMIRRLKKDVMSQLPTKTRTVIKVPMSKPKEYRQAEQDFIKWLAKKSRRKAMRAAAAQQLVKLGYLKRLAAELKLPAVFEWIDNFLASSDQKLLVFGIHKAVLRPLLERYKKIAVLVDGTVTGDKRQSALDKFNTDKKTRLAFMNMHAGGVGWSCKSTSCVLKVELDWVPGNHRQAEDRVHGIGRGKGNAQIWYLIASGSIEEKICQILENKQGVLDQALDGGKVVKALDLYRQLEQQYLGMGVSNARSRKSPQRSGAVRRNGLVHHSRRPV